MKEILVRFLVGGAVVSYFALLGDVLKPKTFGGLLGAAPSVALATLSLTLLKEDKAYAQLEARSMVLGAVAFFFYAWIVSGLLMRKRFSAMAVASASLVVWFAVALGLWWVTLR